MQASDHRANARSALSGNWGVAILVSLLAGIIGGTSNNGFSFNIDISDTADLTSALPAELGALFSGVLSVFGIVLLVFCLALLLVGIALGGVIQLGEARYNLNLIDRKEAELRDLFSQFYRFQPAFLLNLLSGLYIFLWSLLFVIPGIVASYSYAMAPYILLEDPYCTASEALARSKAMMDGNKADLFWLDLTFFGWELLCALTMGIGNLWLNPYKKASRASFYRSLVGGGYRYRPE